METTYLHDERVDAVVHASSDEPGQHHSMRGYVTHYNNRDTYNIVSHGTQGCHVILNSHVPGQNLVAVRVGVFMINSCVSTS